MGELVVPFCNFPQAKPGVEKMIQQASASRVYEQPLWS